MKYVHIGRSSYTELIVAKWWIYALVKYPSLIWIKACRLVGAESLSEPMLEYC